MKLVLITICNLLIFPRDYFNTFYPVFQVYDIKVRIHDSFTVIDNIHKNPLCAFAHMKNTLCILSVMLYIADL